MTLYLGLPLFQSLLSLILFIVVLSNNRRNLLNQLFSYYLLALVAWGILIYLMRSSPDTEVALFRDKLTTSIGLLMPALIYHFSLLLRKIPIKRKTLISIYAIGFLLSILNSSTDLAFRGMQVKSYGYAPIAGPLLPITSLFSLVLAVLALINFWKVARKGQTANERNWGAYIFIGFLASVLGGFCDALPIFGLPLYPGLIFGNIIFCILTTTAILRYKLLDIQFVLRKGSAYLAIGIIIFMPYFIVLVIFGQLLDYSIPGWLYIVILIAILLIIRPLSNLIQTISDRFFFGNRYKFLRALMEFNLEAHKLSDINTLGNRMVQLINNAFDSANTYLFLPTNSGNFEIKYSTNNPDTQLSLNNNNILVHFLQESKTIVHWHEREKVPQLQALSTHLINEFNKIHMDLIVPIITRENVLVGILGLSTKVSEQPYSNEEENTIQTFAHQIAIELENSRLYAIEKETREDLEKQNELKTEFLHSVAHELKTPLTALIASSELLTSEISNTTSDSQKRMVNSIHHSAWFLDRRVSELLDFARMQVDTLTLNKEAVEINSLIKGMVSTLFDNFERKRQTVNIETSNTLLVQADVDKLEQILFNLLSNANKFSPTDSSIIIRSQKDNSKAIIEIIDSAVTISEEEKKKLFQPFYRGEDIEELRRLPGIGLGLVISKRIVELHGGEIWVKNESPKGNTFVFSLPLLESENNSS